MVTEIKFAFANQSKTYKTRDNARKAAEKVKCGQQPGVNLRYIISINEEGRYFPIFIGNNQETIDVVHEGFCCAG